MRLRINRTAAGVAMASLALLGLAACGNGASAVETRDRAAEVTEARLTAVTGASSDEVATTERSGERTVLTANRRETVDAKMQRLYERNGSDFDATSAEDFLAKVTAFTSQPPSGVETVTRPNGDTLMYQASTNTFAVVARNGSPRTMFKPEDGPAYWAEQKAAAPTFGQRRSTN
ncbi:S-type pyocin family protein [Brevundimonas sp. AJA228-03]|uniref:S-type pyocin family protein n=1 Tax=Brevundimonas sp. AJA228-03 TaxID=2752515 RepID=UPI001ADF47DB|nr:S-type pyocin family protein [Brevundimonas sp. AJA228-03]QTN19739.1 S-type pyocin family protein [Brevundimonas sp. AJA228-03]